MKTESKKKKHVVFKNLYSDERPQNVTLADIPHNIHTMQEIIKRRIEETFAYIEFMEKNIENN